MYVCGITPYDATHLGHAATYLAFDLVHRLWRDLGHDVHYVQNVTDIDDPLLERAARDQDDWVVLGMRETALFREDMAALRVLPPRHYIGAVEAMGEIAELVGKLLAQGAAYRVDDPEYPDVYFDAAFTGRFGYESGYDEATMLAYARERGGDPDRPGKRSPLDPLLWRMAREGEPSWESDLGPGRPGWHVECAAIALNRLGTQIDLNGGRLRPDLPPPRVRRRARRGVHRRAPLRPPLHAHRDDRPRRREDVQVARQPGVRLEAARAGRRPERDPARAVGRALPQRPRVDRRAALRGAGAARPLARGRGAGGRARPPPTSSSACAPTSPTTSTRPARSPPSTRGPARRSNAAAPTRRRRGWSGRPSTRCWGCRSDPRRRPSPAEAA
jgi:hypothetical protein